MSVFRIRYKQLGGHVHCRVFSATRWGVTFAKCGDLTITAGAEWDSFCQLFAGTSRVSIVEEDTPVEGGEVS